MKYLQEYYDAVDFVDSLKDKVDLLQDRHFVLRQGDTTVIYSTCDGCFISVLEKLDTGIMMVTQRTVESINKELK